MKGQVLRAWAWNFEATGYQVKGQTELPNRPMKRKEIKKFGERKVEHPYVAKKTGARDEFLPLGIPFSVFLCISLYSMFLCPSLFYFI